jgi:hypothetical protein
VNGNGQFFGLMPGSFGQMPKSSKKRHGNKWNQGRGEISGRRKQMTDEQYNQLVPISHPTTRETTVGPTVKQI